MNVAWRLELVSIGAVAPVVLRHLREDLVHRLAHAVWISETRLSPASAFDRHRQQYLATTLMEMLLDPPPPPGVHRIAVTDVDLFLPVFTHVFGSAQLGGPVGIASLFRLNPQDAVAAGAAAILRQRLLKEVLHELGHTLGLVHCRVPWCAMNPSRLPEEVDLKDAAYCTPCAERVGVPAEIPYRLADPDSLQ